MRKHKSDRAIGALTVLLMALGLIVIYAIGPMRANFMNSAYGSNYGENDFFLHHLVSVAFALAMLVAGFLIPYEKMRKYAGKVVIVGVVACVLLLLLAMMGSGLASCQLGACRWYKLGGMGGFQPAELLKIGLILYLAQLIAKRKAAKKEWDRSSDFWIPFATAVGLSLLLVVVVQKDLGTGVVIMAIAMVMLWMSEMKVRRFLMIVAVVAAMGAMAILGAGHRRERLLTFLGGEGGDSYHIENAMLAIGTGGLFGVGVGNSVQATGYLPESINDSVFAVIGETFGLVGLLAVMGCFMVLLMRMSGVADKVEGEKRMVVMGVFAWIMTHVGLNIMSMTGLIPMTGITLPLLSYGGTSMAFVTGAIGVVLQLSCYTSREVKKHEDISSRRRVGGTHYSSSRRGA